MEDIKNSLHERIDYVIEGKKDSDVTVIFVHGFGVDKHETAGYFDDVAKELGKTYRIIRFDFSGCGKSDGKLEEKDYEKWADDLKAVLKFTKEQFSGKMYIFAQSMGTFVTTLASLDGIEKAVFTGIPNTNTDFIKKRMIDRFGSRPGAVVNTEGISVFPRSSGHVQKIGPSFWTVLKDFDPVSAVTEFSKKTKLLLIHANQDEVIGTEFLDTYGNIPNIKRIFLDGNHSWTIPEQRTVLIEAVEKFYSSNMER